MFDPPWRGTNRLESIPVLRFQPYFFCDGVEEIVVGGTPARVGYGDVDALMQKHLAKVVEIPRC